MILREDDARKVHEAASEIAFELGTALMKMLPGLRVSRCGGIPRGIPPRRLFCLEAATACRNPRNKRANPTCNLRCVVAFYFMDSKDRANLLCLVGQMPLLPIRAA
jgi:hypothetical protein